MTRLLHSRFSDGSPKAIFDALWDAQESYVKGGGWNLLKNGCFRVAQHGTSFTSATTPANSDDTYLLDQWILLSDGNDIVDVSQETSTVPLGAYAAIKLDVETANKKFGIFQPLESRDSIPLLNQRVTLSFDARITGTSLGNLRAGIVSWSSTADTITSDIVSSWGGAGTNPTLATNWTFENNPVSLPSLTTSYKKFIIPSVEIDTSSTANVGVFIWIDDVTTTAGNFLYIGNVKLEIGDGATEFQARPFEMEAAFCQRYLCKTYALATAPGTVVAAGQIKVQSNGTAAGALHYPWRFPQSMLKTPSISLYNPTGGTANTWERNDAVEIDASSAFINSDGAIIYNTEVTADNNLHAVHVVADARL